MIHLPLFWVLDVTKMCDKRNIDHAISRHNPEAKKTLLAYYCCHTISNVEYDKRPNKNMTSP